MSNPPADIQIRLLRKEYKRKLPRVPQGGGRGETLIALEGLDLHIEEGEFFGLLGPNGAGKTTTLGLLTTRVRPTSGTALVAGADVVAQPVLVRQRIGVVPQRPNPDRGLNVIENLLFHAAYFGFRPAHARTRADELLESFGIADKASARVEKLSGGQQQRLMLARALIHEPKILFLDEPTVGLDPQSRQQVWASLSKLNAQGCTIVMSTHHMEEADQLCQRLAIIDRGKLLVVDAPQSLKKKAPGGTLVELTLDGDASGALEKCKQVSNVIEISAVGPLLRVQSGAGGEAIPGLIHAIQAVGRSVKNISLSPPSLETLFIALTGRKLD